MAKTAVNREHALRVSEWYVSSAKWLVTIAAGAIIFGFTRLQEHETSATVRYWFDIAAIALTITAALGIFYIFVSYFYISASVTVPARKLKGFWRFLSTASLGLMILGFVAGMYLFSQFGLAQLEAPSQHAHPELRIYPMPAYGSSILAIAQRGDRLWMLLCLEDGRLVWLRAVPPGSVPLYPNSNH